MKSRLFVVDDASLASTLSSNIASVKIPSFQGDKWIKTIFDIMADMIQIEIGDYIFLWNQRSSLHSSCVYGVFRAISRPYYQCSSPNDTFPFKIHIEPAYELQNPVSEYEILNNPYIKNPLWNIIGKKVSGKPRGSTPLTIDESQYLISLLLDKNKTYRFIPADATRNITIPFPLKIDYSLAVKNSRPVSVSLFNPNKLSPFSPKRELLYEKELEALFNQEFLNKNSSFFSQLDININNVCWYSNYLPYSIERKEMDYVIIESYDNLAPSLISVIEFSINPIDEDHINKVFMYSKWVSQTLALGTANVQPIIISKSSVDFINGEKAPTKKNRLQQLSTLITNYENDYPLRRLKIYAYDFKTSVPKFILKR